MGRILTTQKVAQDTFSVSDEPKPCANEMKSPTSQSEPNGSEIQTTCEKPPERLSDVTKKELLDEMVKMREVISSLFCKVERMQSLLKNVKSAEGTDEGEHRVQVSDMATQTDFTINHSTYAEAVKNGSPVERKRFEEVKEKRQPNITPKSAQKSKSPEHKTDTVSDVKHKDVKKSKVPESTGTKSKSDLPVTFFVHDSIMKYVETERLGNAYGSEIISERASTIDDVENAVDTLSKKSEIPPDAICIHCGINDVKRKDARTAATSMVTCVKNIRKKYPNTKVIVSKISPTHDLNLEIKRNLFNASVCSELFDIRGITTISHENMTTNRQYISADRIHPSRRGTSVLAGNVGRAIRNSFWKLPQRRHQAPRSRFPPKNITTLTISGATDTTF